MLDNKKVIFLTCGILLLAFFAPALMFGARNADDIEWHFIWLQSYLDAVQHGVWYPRWMPDAMAGMGSPAFYFYPPFATVTFAVVDAISLHHLPLAYVISVSAFLMGLGSAIFFYLWSRNFAPIWLAAVLGLAYAVAPYHLLIDYYSRGAIGEYAAYFWIPLIFHAVHRYLSAYKVRWLTLLAISVIGLFFTHLLTAMIVGPVIAVYVLLQFFGRRGNAAPRKPVALVWMALVALLGIGVAGLYFIPALQLFDAANTAALYARPIEGSRLFANLSINSNPVITKYSLFAGVYLVLAGYLLVEYVRARRNGTASSSVTGGMMALWSVVIGLCGLLMWGKFGFVFEAPSPYRSLQFLWRLLIVVEFALLTLVAIVFSALPAPAVRKRVALVVLGVFVLLGAYQVQALVKKFSGQTMGQNDVAVSLRVKQRITPPEYYPKGAGFSTPLDILLQQLKPHIDGARQAWLVEGQGTFTSVEQDYGAFVVHADTSTSAVIAIRQFYFPGWVAQDQNGASLPVFAATPFKFAAVAVGSGAHTIRIARGELPSEALAKKISLGALLILVLALAALGWQARRRASASQP